jgi:hypothetical protein
LPNHLVERLTEYLVARGLPARLEDVPPTAHLIGKADDLGARLRGVESIDVVNADGSVESTASMPDGTPVSVTEGVRAQAIHRDLVELFERVAAKLEGGNRAGAEKLRKASAHWLRHTAASTAVAAGASLDAVRANLGHASLTTTSRYVHSESQRVAQEMSKLWKQLDR